MNCSLCRRHLDAYLDGEVDPNSQIEFERHLATCSECQELLAFARKVKAEVRRSCSAAKAPPHLRARIGANLAEERRAAREPTSLVRAFRMPKGVAIPLAVAASVLMGLTWGIGTSDQEAQTARASTMPMLEDVVRAHSSELPADVRADRPQQVERFFRNKVRFPVRAAEFERRDTKLIGGRLSNVRDRRAAALYYDVGGRRMTMVVFDGPGPLEEGAFRARMLGRSLYYQHVNGYTVPVRRQDGLTYAFTADAEQQTVLRLAASARVRY